MKVLAKIFTTCLSLLFATTAGAWTFSASTDKMTDEKIATATQASKGVVVIGQKASLSFRRICSKENMEIILSHPMVVGGGPVNIRLDKNKAKLVYAKESQDHRALFIGDKSAYMEPEGHPNNLAEEFRKHKVALVGYKSAGGAGMLPEFSLRGLDAALKKVEKYCGSKALPVVGPTPEPTPEPTVDTPSET